MREIRAKQHGVTLYEMVRDPKLYPLATYLDAADLALERDPKNLATFIRGLSDTDAGMRYWAVVGLHLLEQGAAPARAQLKESLQDQSDEVRIMAAWTLVKLGQKDAGLQCLRTLLYQGCTADRKLLNVLDWMDEDAVPLVREYLKSHPKKATNILAKIAQDYGIDIPGN
jgi:hypothetical protein